MRACSVEVELEDGPLSPDDVQEFAARVVALGCELGLTVGTAESCTGGLVAGAITEVAGSSSVLRGGVVSYAPEVKHDVLGVAQATIDGPGVVSVACAREMAEGAQRVLGCDVAVSVTGIAGPSGEEPGKPVGTVCLGLATESELIAQVHLFAGDRAEVRLRAVACALGLLCEGLMEHGALTEGQHDRRLAER